MPHIGRSIQDETEGVVNRSSGINEQLDSTDSVSDKHKVPMRHHSIHAFEMF